MPITPTYPGVYIEELPADPHNIIGAATSTAAFIDYFPRGPLNDATLLTSFADFQRLFGGLDHRSEASYQIMQFFLNGGTTAYAVRIAPANAVAAWTDIPPAHFHPTQPPSLTSPTSRLRVLTANPGTYGNRLRAAALESPTPNTFTVVIQETDSAHNIIAEETFPNLSLDPNSQQYFFAVVNERSTLVTLKDNGPTYPNPALLPTQPTPTSHSWHHLHSGTDGHWDTASNELTTALLAALGSGTDNSPLLCIAPNIFNTLCLPVTTALDPASANQVIAQAQAFCQQQRAFYIVDIPSSTTIATPQQMASWFTTNAPTLNTAYAAIYYPRLIVPDLLSNSAPREIPSSGTVAGIYAATDTAIGVWKAPAGITAAIPNANLAYSLTDTDNELLNPLGINALRTFPDYGNVVWGARTLRGADTLADSFQYIPTRRLASFIENSLMAGLNWAVFEPNDESLWSALRLTVSTFMSNLQQQGAFYQYTVTCDATTTTPYDIDRGVVNIIVTFAPVKPAEFIVLQISQTAGQSS